MKDKTKELADSVGAVYPVLFMGRHDGVLFTETELETFVELVAAAEREACAKVCDEEAREAYSAESVFLPQGNPLLIKIAEGARRCGNAIRARGTT